MDEKRSRTEITIETLSVTKTKKRETVQPAAFCSNCGHELTTFDSKQTEPVIDERSKMIGAGAATN